MDGRDVAFALRAIEAGLGVKRTPLLFFSAVLCDEPFKQVLADLGNAKYIRKAEGGDVQQLGEVAAREQEAGLVVTSAALTVVVLCAVWLIGRDPAD